MGLRTGLENVDRRILHLPELELRPLRFTECVTQI
jgi:hypothetical protein